MQTRGSTTALVVSLAMVSLGTMGRDADVAAAVRRLRGGPPACAQAALELVQADTPPSRKAVLASLEAGDRSGALCAWALRQHPRPWAREALEGLIPGPDQVTGYWAAKALGRLGDERSVVPLAHALADERNAYWELSRGGHPFLGDRRVGNRNVILFAPDWMPNIRVAYAAMRALGDVGGPNALEVLRAALADPQYLVRLGAVEGLGEAGEAADRNALAEIAAGDPVLVVRRAARIAAAGLAGAPVAPSPPPRLPEAVVFVVSTIRSESNLGFRDSYFYPKTPWYQGGGNLFVLSPVAPDGEVTNLTKLESGLVQGPEVSWDGTRILFAMRRDAKTDGFHIFEINADGTGLRQLTHGNCNDVDPCYLSDGRIAFCSDRAGYREYYHQERSRVLYLMDADGSNVEQVTFNPNQDYEPLALRDGRVVYGSYRFYAQDGSPGVLPHERNMQRIETVLRTIRPDGSDDQHLYGSFRGTFYTPIRPTPDSLQASGWHPRGAHIGVSVSQPREMPDGRLLCVTPAGLTIVDPSMGMLDCERPLYPEILNLAGGEETYIHSHDEMNPVGRYTTPYPLDATRALVSHAPWYDLRREAYDLYLIDLETRERRLIYADSDHAVVEALPLAPRASPRTMATVRPASEGESGTVYCNSVFLSDVPYDRSRARFVQVIEGLPMGLSVNANGSFRTRVLGTVPLQEDGSFYVEVPANTAFRFQILDINETILVHETAFNYVRPGETKGCIGCHEPRDATPINAQPKAVRHPPFKTYQRGRLIYQGALRRPYSHIIR